MEASNKENYELAGDIEAQDELSAPLSGGRFTPQHSLLEPSSSSAKPTPYANVSRRTHSVI